MASEWRTPVTARILVVDDTPANIQTLVATLKPQGYQVLVATNGKQALEVMERVRPDLVLLDILMPEMDGFEACAQIKAREAWRQIPVIFLTAKTDTADLVKGFELGAVDYVGKPFNAHELLARVSTHLTIDQLRAGLAERNAALEEARAQITRELDIARALQIAILPRHFPSLSGCSGSARMLPATTMGGDFYDFIELPDGRVGLVMADVSGKGVPAAFFMAVARTNLRAIALRHSSPGACLAETNEVLCRQNPMDLFVTVFYAIYDPASGRLAYANGGHNPPYLRRAEGEVETLDGAGGIVLGMLPGSDYPDHAAQLQVGDRLVLFTDGVTEATNERDELYGDQPFKDLIKTAGAQGAAELVEATFAEVTRFAGAAKQSDDITLAILERRVS
jgi:phosphoserine phosphatase RsbU/P